MCYSISSKPTQKKLDKLQNNFKAMNKIHEEMKPFHVASGFSHPLLPTVTAEGELTQLRWGLIPGWVKDWEAARKLRVQTLNAMSETIDSKASFRTAVKQGRFCIIPVDGFYEWHHHPNGEKYPHFIYPKNDDVFYVAGLYEQWTNQAIEEVHNTFTIVTTAANKRMEWIHNSKKRMPVILTLDGAKAWMDPSLPYSEKKQLLAPCDETLMADHPISRLITSRKENPNQEKVSEPFEYPELALSI